MTKELIARFWGEMGTNDFFAAARLLTPDFEHFMPQSGEVLRGPKAFAEMNTAYPAQGPWRFAVRTILADGAEAVSDVVVTDGVTKARAITFHTVRDGLIARQVEYWPDDFPAPDWRRTWVTQCADFPG